MCEVSDLMEQFFFFRIANKGTEEPISNSEALTPLTYFTAIDPKYNYSLEPDSDCNDEEDGIDEAVDSSGNIYQDSAKNNEDEPRFVLIS